MQPKRGLVLSVTLLLVLLSLFNLMIIATITGLTTQGVVSICLGRAPQISITNQTATESEPFSYQVSPKLYGSNTSVTYFDNTSLFNINSNGLISFTPSTGSKGTYNIQVTVQDSSSCLAINSSTSFLLTINEAAAAAAAVGGAAGGGAEGSSELPKKLSFQLSENILKISLKETEKLEKNILIKNDGEVPISISFDNPLVSLFSIVPTSVDLSPGQEHELRLIFNSWRTAEPGVYSGRIIFTGTDQKGRLTQRSLNVVVEVETEEVLIDSSLDLTKKTYLPGENLTATVTIFNLQKITPAEVTLIYTISNFQNNTIVYEEKETITLEEQASFSKTIPLPADIAPDQYLLAVKINYGKSFASSTEIFTVEAPPVQPSALAGLAAPVAKIPAFVLAIPFLFILILVIFALFYWHHQKTKGHLIIKKQTIIKPRTVKIIKEDHYSLRRKLSLLQESYEKGYLKKEIYEKTKKELEKILKKQA